MAKSDDRKATSTPRGFTLIENMIAMGVMLVGALGLMGLHNMGVTMNGDALRVTRATAIAQDLVGNIEAWNYDEGGPLQKVSTSNSTDIGDLAQQFERVADPVGTGLADHGEDDLDALGTGWYGLPTAALNGVYERYWNVLYSDTNGDGTNDAVQIAVVVRWRQGAGWRRVVLHAVKLNPARA
ncbi:MAG: prepilin-type N-terminal cleavage/methylation domain-containing protein [Anaeromyxobacteraceae bacterium]